MRRYGGKARMGDAARVVTPPGFQCVLGVLFVVDAADNKVQRTGRTRMDRGMESGRKGRRERRSGSEICGSARRAVGENGSQGWKRRTDGCRDSD